MPSGPPPKHPGTRRRTNQKSTRAVLSANPDISVPPLPNRGADPWHPQTVDWWVDIWRSPMGPEYDDSDIHALYVLAGVVDDYWTATSATERRAASAEIRLQSVRFGLSPMDRRRLEWQIEETEKKKSEGARRRAQEADQVGVGDQKPPDDGDDPRGWLEAL